MTVNMTSFDNLGSWVRSHRVILILSSIILLGGFLRIYNLGSESLWLDEVISVSWSKKSVASIVELAGNDVHPPLYFIILHLWMLLFGTSEIAIRALSAIFGIISIFLIYIVGCQLFDRKIGLISSFLLSISYFQIMYSQNARGYSLLLLLTLLSFFFFIKILKSDRVIKWHFTLLCLANVCLAYTNVFGLFVIIAQVFYLLLLWNKYKQIRIWFLGVQVAILAFFSPWIATFIGQISRVAGDYWIHEPSLWEPILTIVQWIGTGGGTVFTLLLFAVLCLIGLFTIIRKVNWEQILRKPLRGLKELRWRVGFKSAEETLLLLIWLSLPILLPFTISMFFTPIYILRVTISASPALYLLVAKGVSSFAPKIVTYFIVIVIALLCLPGLHFYYTHDVNEQWRETADLIECNTQANDVVIICADYCQDPFDYYYDGVLEEFGIRVNLEDTQEIAAVVDDAIAGKDRLWFVLSHQGTAITEWYLVDRFGNDSIIFGKKFVGIRVYLFDLQAQSP